MSGDAIFRGRIYRITNMVNGKVYVGQTVQSLKERFVWHCSVNGFKKTVIGRAIRKYGRENFRIDALQECYSKEEMDQAESYWIKARGTVAPNGYNIRPGGGCHAPVHEETKSLSQ